MRTLGIDIETFSPADLKKCGVYKYVESPDFEILTFQWSFDGEPAKVVSLVEGEQLPDEVFHALYDPGVLKTAYNAAFELTCLNRWLRARALPELIIEQWECTSVHALYLGLPGNLGDVGKVLKTEAQKLDGWPLIRYFCLPCKPTQRNGHRTRNLPRHDPDKWQKFLEYGRVDVDTEQDIRRRLMKHPVPARLWRLWHVDQRINARGVAVDLRLVERAIELDTEFKERATREAIELTGLTNPRSVPEFLAWLQQELEDGDEEVRKAENLQKKTILNLLKHVKDDTLRRVLELRQQLSKSSVSKYHAIKKAACADGRVRGLYQFYGANRTGRWAARLVQTQNLASNKLQGDDLNLARELVLAGDFETLEMLFGPPPMVLSELIRTAFISPTGELASADFSSIEAVVLSWIAQETWRLEVFATHGKIYEASASRMFNVPWSEFQAYIEQGKKHPLRQKGKVSELALGYQGGTGAMKTMGALEMGLREDELQPIVDAWREANPRIKAFWRAMEEHAIRAVKNKGMRCVLTEVFVREKIDGEWTVVDRYDTPVHIIFTCEDGMLFVSLPSGRRLAYVKPRIEAHPEYGSDQLKYWGRDQKTGKWGLLDTYGGKLTENWIQGFSADCLGELLLRLDDRNITPVMHTHDEANVQGGQALLDVMLEDMARPIDWAPGLSLKGAGSVLPYYMKED